MGMRVLSFVAAGALLTAGCDVQVGEKGFSLDIARGKVSDEWVRTYTLSANGRVEIEGVNGTIEVMPAQGREVEVRAEREIRSHSDEAAREALQKVQMLEEVSPDRVRVQATGVSEDQFPFGRHDSLSIRYTVRVPPALTVALKTQNGGIRVQDVNARVEASSTNGGITIERLSGSLAANVVNGGVRADLAAVTGEVRISSTNGGVRLDLPLDVKADLDASWVNGGINVDRAFRVEAVNDSRRQLSARLNGGGPRISLTTVNGGLRVRARGGSERN